MYVKVSLKDKSVTPKNIDNWIFSNYVNFVFTVKNNSNKAIKGIQGTAVFKDQFEINNVIGTETGFSIFIPIIFCVVCYYTVMVLILF